MVYAACYAGTDVEHRRVTQIEEIPMSCGSKYIPSNLGKTFRYIQTDLMQGIPVLFAGTSCQCAGLRSFLRDDLQQKLICVDFICHGIPSKAAWRAFLETQAKDGDRIIGVNMRDKSSGCSKYQYSWRIQYENKGEVWIPQDQVSFMNGFVKDLYLRPSCYVCQFRGISRKTDITLADYWGVWEAQPDMDDNKGTSLVLLHTEKGKALFTKIKGNLMYQEADLESAITYNKQMVVSPNQSEKRVEFFQRLSHGEDFSTIVADLTQVKLSKKQKICKVLRCILRKRKRFERSK